MMAALFGFILLFLLGQGVLERLGLFTTTVATIWSLCFIIGIGAGSVAFFWRLWRLLDPPEYRLAREHGIPATARVLDVRVNRAYLVRRYKKHFYTRGVRTKREYLFRLLVTRPGAEPYEATMVEFLDLDRAKVPKKGATITVNVHPQRPEIMVFVSDTTP
jgi:hypothetical protein